MGSASHFDINMATNSHKPLVVVPSLRSEIVHLICLATIQSPFAKGWVQFKVHVQKWYITTFLQSLQCYRSYQNRTLSYSPSTISAFPTSRGGFLPLKHCLTSSAKGWIVQPPYPTWQASYPVRISHALCLLNPPRVPTYAVLLTLPTPDQTDFSA